MKKCYSLLRWPCLLGCAQRLFTVQNKPAAVAPKETITHHFLRFWKLGRRKLSMQPKFMAAQKMLLNRNPTNIRKWIARFYCFRRSLAGSAVMCAHRPMSCPSIWATLSLSLIYFWSSSCFCIVISLSLRVK